MKKYLIKGALALFGGGLLFSCAEKESEYVPLAQQKVKAFDELFREAYGDIDPYQTWGFNSGKITIDPNDPSQVIEVIDITDGEEDTNAQTRMLARFRARTRGKSTTDPYCDTEGKFWYDNYGYTPPAKVTEAERAKVLDEFNKVHTDRGVSINFTDYFVQQVYSCKNDETHHKYKSFPGQNGDHERQYKKAWEHMDQLLCGLEDTHSYNFNANGTTEIETWDGKTLGGGDGKQKVVEKDSIQLMVNCDTKRFGYHNSLDSKDHYEYIILEIDGAYYVGFDFCASYSFKTKNDDGSFVKSDYDQDPGEEYDANFNGYTPISDNEIKYNSDGTIKGYEGGDKDIHRDYIYNDWIVKITPASLEEPPYVPQPYEETHEVYENVWTPVEAGRVFCEDLGSTASRKDLDYNDLVFDARIWKYQRKTTTYTWSYKDVDDTDPTKSETGTSLSDPTYYADIKLIAAGGTIPITIANRQVHSLFVEPAAIATMVNTRDNNSTAYGSYETRDAVAIGNASLGDEYKKFRTTDGSEFELWLIPGYSSISAIPIRSAFGEGGSDVVELGADTGEAPHKIMVKYGTTRWTSERKEILEAYPRFGEYAQGRINESGWVDEPVPSNLYSEVVNGENSSLPQEIRSRRDVVGDTETILWTGSEALGNTWGYASLSSPYTMEDGFYPGDVIRFHGTVTAEGDNAPIITVSFADDSQPYLIENMQFAEKENGSYPAEAYVGVELDQSLCNRINNSKVNGQITLHVQGRGFTLTKIGFVPYKTTGQ